MQPSIQKLDNLLAVIRSINLEPEDKIKLLDALKDYVDSEIRTIDKMLEITEKTNNKVEDIYHFEDWVQYMLNNSDYSEAEIMEFEEHYQNLLNFQENTNQFIIFIKD